MGGLAVIVSSIVAVEYGAMIRRVVGRIMAAVKILNAILSKLWIPLFESVTFPLFFHLNLASDFTVVNSLTWIYTFKWLLFILNKISYKILLRGVCGAECGAKERSFAVASLLKWWIFSSLNWSSTSFYIECTEILYDTATWWQRWKYGRGLWNVSKIFNRSSGVLAHYHNFCGRKHPLPLGICWRAPLLAAILVEIYKFRLNKCFVSQHILLSLHVYRIYVLSGFANNIVLIIQFNTNLRAMDSVGQVKLVTDE